MTTSHHGKILTLTADSQVAYLLERVLRSDGYEVLITSTLETARRDLFVNPSITLVVVDAKVGQTPGIDLAGALLVDFPGLAVCLVSATENLELLKHCIQIGVGGILSIPLKAEDLLSTIKQCIEKNHQVRQWVLKDEKKSSANLQRMVDEMETLTRLGRAVTSSLDLDEVLSAVVDAAVELSGAEEGSLLLLDEQNGELYMRAGRNFQKEFAQSFRLPVRDSLAGAVLTSGVPVLLDEKSPQKIKTTYLVHSLIYVPLESQGVTFGVLGVDNRLENRSLTERDVKLLRALAEFAVIAIQNANLHQSLAQEHQKLEAILAQIEDGLLAVDKDQRLILANQAALQILALEGQAYQRQPVTEIILQTELVELALRSLDGGSTRTEFSTPDGRIFSAMANEVPGLGRAVAFHDISHLKKLDRIKSDFVNTVSHDLRSPLTAILGYVDLIERLGAINDQQRDCIRRVQINVQNITNLVNDLLNLGRIEAGFDTRKESLALDHLIRHTVESNQKRIFEKGITAHLEIGDELPSILANPLQMRQMIENLLDNALKYTPVGGKVTIQAFSSQSQFIFKVIDSGIGIPVVDMPYIFDKFYRAGNVDNDIPGTGLGLAIVRSIVDYNDGRIWVDSVVGQGTTVTVVFPQI